MRKRTCRIRSCVTVSVFQVLNWSDYCLPLAYSPGQPYRAVAEASLENFSRLGVAFMEDRLHMENGLIPEKIVCEFDLVIRQVCGLIESL